MIILIVLLSGLLKTFGAQTEWVKASSPSLSWGRKKGSWVEGEMKGNHFGPFLLTPLLCRFNDILSLKRSRQGYHNGRSKQHSQSTIFVTFQCATVNTAMKLRICSIALRKWNTIANLLHFSCILFGYIPLNYILQNAF